LFYLNGTGAFVLCHLIVGQFCVCKGYSSAIVCYRWNWACLCEFLSTRC